VTVCIAARAGPFVFGASDRMLTSGDVQFEPTAAAKTLAVTNSIFAMTAGDSGLQAQIMTLVLGEVQTRIQQNAAEWWLVRDITDLYIKYYNEIRKKRAADAILSPLYLDANSFITNQNMMNDRLLNDTAKELLNFRMSSVSIIFAGHDPIGPHIYVVHESDTNSLEANCLDGVGFVAIGSGGRHASSQFMFARHAWDAPMADTLFLTYYAKRKSEVAPGVGNGTDMVMSGPALASLINIAPAAIKKLEFEYQRVIKSEGRAFTRGKEGIKHYVEDLERQAKAAAPQQQASPKDSGESPSADQSKV
jgi:hypothetical protein